MILAGTFLFLVAFFTLLGWALVRTGGAPGGLGINNVFGEVPIKEGPAPDFSLQVFGGESVRLSDLKGKVVMIDFWSSWCVPCRREAPSLAQVYREYKGERVEFIGISIWDRVDDALDYVQRFGITYPTGLDTEGKILVDYGVRGIPEKFFIDPQGNIVRKFIGPSSAGDLRDILDELLAASD